MADSAGKQQNAPGKPTGSAAPAESQGAVATDEPTAVAHAEDGPARFSPEQLLDHSRRLTGVSRHVLFGALSTHDGSPLTSAEATALAEDFCSKEVAPR